jgi:polyisoprenyl-teichoic acid--peptidoglycan teichoic acid transferase
MKQNRQQPSHNAPQPVPSPDPTAGANQPPQYIEQFQPVRVQPSQKKKASGGSCSCLLSAVLQAGLLAVIFLFVLLAVYLLAPTRTNLLLLGIDRVPDGTALGRSDTMILVSVVPLKPSISMLSIPRDLWVNIPDVGENRINTAHFFAETERVGSGPSAAVRTVEQNFGVKIPYYVRLRFDAFLRIVDALGGVNLNLSSPMGGLPAGQHRLNGENALAFVRDRQGGDDFFRMEQSQLLMRSVARQMLSPNSLPQWPAVFQAVYESVDTNLPVWQWPRLGLAVLRAGDSGIDSRTINRSMVTPFTTDMGANVLLPEWTQINPLMDEMFQP